MKLHIEVNYDMPEEPAIFLNIETLKTRKIYLWEDKKAIIELDANYNSYLRSSEITDEPENGFMEIWVPFTESPPQNIDDSWVEEYKIIELTTFYLEWHPKNKKVRLSWNQQAHSYQEGLVKAAVLDQLNSLSLQLPPLAKVRLT